MLKRALSIYLMNVYRLLRGAQRDRGVRPGIYLERDLEMLAHSQSLWTQRRVRRAPYGGVYYSGLTPETDLFVYEGSQFLHIEAKDLSVGIGRAIPTEFWARALDLHLGRACDSWPDAAGDHYAILVTAENASDQVRAACLRWSVCLVEPSRIPILVLATMGPTIDEFLVRAGCAKTDLNWACVPFNQRFPRDGSGVLLPFGRVRRNAVTDALLRFQRIASYAMPSLGAKTPDVNNADPPTSHSASDGSQEKSRSA